MRTTITLAATLLVLLMGFHPADADNALLPLREASAARFRLIDTLPAAFGDVADRQAVSTTDQTVRLAPADRRVRYERRIIVVEDEGMPVLRVARPAGTGVSGAEVAGRVVRRLCFSRTRLFPSLPGAITPVRRHEDPLPRQGVEASVRIGFQVEHRSFGPATGAVTGWNGSIYQNRI